MLRCIGYHNNQPGAHEVVVESPKECGQEHREKTPVGKQAVFQVFKVELFQPF